jgi:hypothetical protein
MRVVESAGLDVRRGEQARERVAALGQLGVAA